MLTLANRLRLAGSSFKQLAGVVTTMQGASTASEWAFGVAVDSAGYIISVGKTDPGTPAGYVAKHSASGTLQWQRKLVLAVTCSAVGVALDSSDNVFVAAVGRASGSYNGLYLLKFNSSGTLQWQRRLYDASAHVTSQGAGVYVNASGDVFISGEYTSAIGKGYLAKYSTGGSIQWQRAYSHASDGVGLLDVAADSAGNLHVVGRNQSGATYKCLVMQVSSTGAITSQTKLNGPGGSFNYISKLAIDGSGNIFCSGSMTGADLNSHGFAAKLNSSLAVQWAKQIDGTSPPSTLAACVLAPDGDLIACGTNGIFKFEPSAGALTWQRTLSASTGTYQLALALNGATGFVTAAALTIPSNGYDGTVAALPTAGSATGTYGSYINYAAASWTATTFTFTASAPGNTDAAGSMTEAAGDITDSAGTLTSAVQAKTA